MLLYIGKTHVLDVVGQIFVLLSSVSVLFQFVQFVNGVYFITVDRFIMAGCTYVRVSFIHLWRRKRRERESDSFRVVFLFSSVAVFCQGILNMNLAIFKLF